MLQSQQNEPILKKRKQYVVDGMENIGGCDVIGIHILVIMISAKYGTWILQRLSHVGGPQPPTYHPKFTSWHDRLPSYQHSDVRL